MVFLSKRKKNKNIKARSKKKNNITILICFIE